MSSKISKLKTYISQLTRYNNLIFGDDEDSGGIAEEIFELKLELDFSEEMGEEPDPKTILNINNKIRSYFRNNLLEGRTKQKYAIYIKKITDRIIRLYNLSGTEKILKGKELADQWIIRNRIASGANKPTVYDKNGNPLNGFEKGLYYQQGKLFNGEVGGLMYQRGLKMTGNKIIDGQNIYFQFGKRFTGNRKLHRGLKCYVDGIFIGGIPNGETEIVPDLPDDYFE